MAEKIFCVITVARQIEGEYVFIKTEKAFKQASKADAFLQKKKSEYVVDGKPKAMEISTPNGVAKCICEIGAFELEVEE